MFELNVPCASCPKIQHRFSGRKLKVYFSPGTDGCIRIVRQAWSLTLGQPGQNLVLHFFRVLFIDISLTLATLTSFEHSKFAGHTTITMGYTTEATLNDFDSDVSFHLTNCEWNCDADCTQPSQSCYPSCWVFLVFSAGTAIPFSVHNSTLQNVQIHAYMYFYGEEVSVENSVFTSGADMTSGGLTLLFRGAPRASTFHEETVTVRVTNCTFRRLSNLIPSYSRMFDKSEVAALKIEFHGFLFYYTKSYALHITACTFEDNNVRALSISGDLLKFFRLYDSIFVKNCVLQGPGAGLSLDTSNLLEATEGMIKDCLFVNNAAGFARHLELFNDFNLKKRSQKFNQSEAASGSGNGGALSVSGRSFLVLENLRFLNNTANAVGGSIYASRRAVSNITLKNCTFLQDVETSQHGSVLYTMRQLVVESAIILATNSRAKVSVVSHSGGLVTFDKFHLSCPVGRNIKVSKYFNEKYVANFEHIDQLTFMCPRCPTGFYSVDKSFLEMSRENETLQWTQHRITCQPCPYGAICTGDIVSMPSYWGYIHWEEVHFVRCSRHHCCAQYPCPGFDSCSANRKGKLCTQCDKGFSQNFFTSTCAEECKETLLWGTILFSIVMFAAGVPLWNHFTEVMLRCHNKFFSYTVTFFSQDLMLFTADLKQLDKIQSIFTNSFALQLSVLNFLPGACSESFGTTEVLLMTAMLGPGILVVHVIIFVLAETCRSKQTCKVIQKSAKENMIFVVNCSFQPVFIVSLKLLHCVNIGGTLVSVTDATVNCFQKWQYAVCLFVFLGIVPFLIHRMFPEWFNSFTKQTNNTAVEAFSGVKNPQNARAKICSPLPSQNFSRTTNTGPVNWLGLTLVKRSALCIVFVFVTNPLTKILFLTTVVVISLCFLSSFPHKSEFENWLEFESSCVLFLLGISSTILSAFESTLYEQSPRIESVMSLIEYFENLALSWAPTLVVTLVLMYATVAKLFCFKVLK